MSSIALWPSHGRAPCVATPVVVISKARRPFVAISMPSAVGSATIATSAFTRPRPTRYCMPSRPPTSSSQVKIMTRLPTIGRQTWRAARTAISKVVSPDFVSIVPRPTTCPSTTLGSNGGWFHNSSGPGGTISRWSFRRSVGPGCPEFQRAIMFGRPTSAEKTSTERPIDRQRFATNSPISASCPVTLGNRTRLQRSSTVSFRCSRTS